MGRPTWEFQPHRAGGRGKRCRKLSVRETHSQDCRRTGLCPLALSRACGTSLSLRDVMGGGGQNFKFLLWPLPINPGVLTGQARGQSWALLSFSREVFAIPGESTAQLPGADFHPLGFCPCPGSLMQAQKISAWPCGPACASSHPEQGGGQL